MNVASMCVGQWVEVVYQDKRMMGTILQIDDSTNEIQVQCLLPVPKRSDDEQQRYQLETERDAVFYTLDKVLNMPKSLVISSMTIFPLVSDRLTLISMD